MHSIIRTLKGRERSCSVIYNPNLASAKVIQLYRSLGWMADWDYLNLTLAYPRSDSPEDIAASQFTDDFLTESS